MKLGRERCGFVRVADAFLTKNFSTLKVTSLSSQKASETWQSQSSLQASEPIPRRKENSGAVEDMPRRSGMRASADANGRMTRSLVERMADAVWGERRERSSEK